MAGVDLASVRRLAAATSSVPARLEASLAVPALCDEIDELRAIVDGLQKQVYLLADESMAQQRVVEQVRALHYTTVPSVWLDDTEHAGTPECSEDGQYPPCATLRALPEPTTT